MTQISQIDRGNLDKVAVDNGFVIPQLDQDGWMLWEAHVPASLRFTLDGDTYVAAVIRCNPRLWAVVAKNELTGKLVARRDLKSKHPNVPHIIVDNKESVGVISSRSDHTRDECNGSDRIAV